MDEIVGRKREKETLEKIFQSHSASFIAVYGRRRIGKTYLIKNFFRERGVFFHLEGVQDAPLPIQLQNFSVEFADCFLKGKQLMRPQDWFSAFQNLRKEIEKVPKNCKVILFFDELPWIASPKSFFLQALEHLWNRYLCDMKNVILIVCGSAASWMIDHVINDKGGLHGRVTKEIRLLPFTLAETTEFLQTKNIHLDRKQILELYMCFGGVARYLSYLERGHSVAQMVGELCFSFNAPLIAEFHKLYRSLFQNYEEHVKIVKLLATSREGFSYSKLVENLGVSSGGTLTKRLEELKLSGFITEKPSFGEGVNSNFYQLIDEYSLFYLTWQADVSALELQNRSSDYWMKQRNSQSWKIWTGYAFESLCLKHVEGIKKALGIEAVNTRTSRWHSKGAQIDAVIDRADNCINLIELKFYEKIFVVTREYAEKLKQKRVIFETVTQVRKATFTTLITPYGVKKNGNSLSSIDQELTMDCLFLA